MKKLLSLMMACVMILALAVPAFAADDYFSADSESDQLSQSLTFAARTFVPTVRLSLPALDTNPVVLNPYKISYTVTADEGNVLNGVQVDAADDQAKQVISPVYAIANQTDVKLKYSFSTTATLGGEMAISNDHVAISETNKKLYLSLVVAKAATNTAPSGNDTAQALDFSDTANFETIAVKTTEVKSSTSIERSLVVPTAPSTDPVNYLLFQFQGDMTRTPTKAWTAEDTISVVVAFTFTPESKQDYTASYSDTTAIAKAEASITTAKTYLLPVGTTAGVFTSPTGATFHATPEWAIVSAGGLTGLSVTTNNELALSTDGQKAIPADNTEHTFKVVLSFKDKNSIPRTLELSLGVKRANA